MMKQLVITFTLLLYVVQISSAQLIDDTFETLSDLWQTITLSGSGKANTNDSFLNISASEGSSFGVYNKTTLSGHFDVQIDFKNDNNVSLALFNVDASGNADVNNYTMIRVDDKNGKVIVSVQDKQNGVTNVLDNTNKTDKNFRYKNIVDGQSYSVPFVGTAKRLRILRHENENFFHFYYYVSKSVKGKTVSGWTELAPSKEWLQLSGNFYMGLIANNGSANFDNAKAYTRNMDDISDENTGFKATRRQYAWSGYYGDAIVVSFDKEQAPLTQGTRKFVFWAENNYIPAWHLDDSLQFTMEFVETWGGGSDACHEPMSDRLLRFSSVKILEDNSIRKVIHWHYVLHDPDYKIPDDAIGSQLPEVDEYYYIYSDGTIIRKIQYRPKLDTEFRKWHELTEFIVIAGKNTNPSGHMSNPCLTIWPICGNKESYYPSGGSDYDHSKNDATILAAHFKNHPDVFEVFNDNPTVPSTYAGNAINIYKTWHNINYAMSHWPVNKEQYHTDAFKSSTTWDEQIKHSSIVGAGIYGGTDWNDNYKTDENGRKYREWYSFISLSEKGRLNEAKLKTEKWLSNPDSWEPVKSP